MFIYCILRCTLRCQSKKQRADALGHDAMDVKMDS